MSRLRIGSVLLLTVAGASTTAEPITVAEQDSRSPIGQAEALFATGEFIDACRILVRHAKQGNASAWALIGRCYEEGKGLPQNLTEAFKWYRESALNGDTEAENKVGEMLLAGRGTAVNLQEYRRESRPPVLKGWVKPGAEIHPPPHSRPIVQIGRASCRERV